ncbi:MAG: porin [Burkholderiales bacterium]|nr:porin [Burkholderiales bacterium]
MKKSVLAMAVMAISGAAAAQSSVTLFGVVDATLARGSGSVSSKTQLTNSGYTSSRVGFRGIEDLSGGLRAGFHLEAGVTPDDGQGSGTNSNNQATGAGAAVAGRQGLTFNRRSTVSLGGGWGELRLGRDYTPQFWNQSVYDPFNTNGVGTNQVTNSNIGGATNTRASNSVTYLWGHGFNASTSTGGGGFHVAAQYFLGENNSGTATSHDGNGGGIRAGYNGGPVSVAATYASTKYASGDITMANIGGAYDFGVARAFAMYERDRVASAVALTGNGYLAGVSVPVGAGEVRAAFSRYRTDAAGTPATRKLSLGYIHNLSKRTALYATYARVRNTGGAAQALNGSVTSANGSSSGLDLGIRHAF